MPLSATARQPTDMLTGPGLYVHLPWCVRKCPYCDFNSHELRTSLPADSYIEALLKDLEAQVERFSPHPFASVFFGGGTPSLFSGAQIARVLEAIEHTTGLSGNAEITLEANPGTIEHDSFEAYSDAGVNRISLGVQSFDDALLKSIGRIHSGADAETAIQRLVDSPIPRFNLDLMFGLPGQNVNAALEDVDRALSFGVTHLSHYQLTIEPNTLFAVKTPELPGEDQIFQMQQQCHQRLRESGLQQYEVSAHAIDKDQSRHNLNYWKFGDYIGIGAGAHGKVSTAGLVTRTEKAKHPRQYQLDPVAVVSREISPNEQLFEFMLNRLRLNQPVSIKELAQRTAVDPDKAGKSLRKAVKKKLMAQDKNGLFSTTELGWRFLNDLQQVFLP